MTGYIADQFQNPVAPKTFLMFLAIVCGLCFAWGFISDRRRGR